MREGIENEELIITQYKDKMQKGGHAGLEVNSCGFFVSKTHGFLGASPDGLVTEPSSENPSGLVEAKNIRVNENESPMAALIRKGICTKDGNIKKSHKYYYQIQQQEFVVNRQWCDFVVRGSNEEMYCKRVPYDLPWWNEKLLHLEEFYDRFILTELAYPRLKYGLKRCDFNFQVHLTEGRNKIDTF